MSGLKWIAATVFAAVAILVPAVQDGASSTLHTSRSSIRQAKGVLPAVDDFADALVLQPDGKLVAAGNSYYASTDNEEFALVRYNPNGSLDRSFGTGGRVTTSFASHFNEVYALVLQPDGKLVAAGTTYSASADKKDFALARYNRNGSLDKSFGTSGKVTTTFPGSEDDAASALVLQPDGKLVAAGITDEWEYGLARYNPNGTLDKSFGADGMVTTAFPGGTGDDEVHALVLQPDGKLVAAGQSDLGDGEEEISLARYQANGSLDPSFNGTGTVTTPITGLDYDQAWALVLQPDGKLVAAGESSAVVQYGIALVRYNADGSLDPSFGEDGKVTARIGLATALALQPDGKLVAASESNNFALLRYGPDGSLDTSFNSTGTVTTTIRSTATAYALALQPDGRLIAAGGAFQGSTQRDRLSVDFALARYNANGSLDSSFGTNGTVTTKFRCIVPNVKGMKLAVAKLAIRRDDCSVGRVSTALSATAKKGSVIHQTPRPGANRKPGTKIKLTISRS